MRRRLKRYEVDIRLYMDKEKKSLFKFINWHTWAWGLEMANRLAKMEARIQVKKYASVKTFTVEVAPA